MNNKAKGAMKLKTLYKVVVKLSCVTQRTLLKGRIVNSKHKTRLARRSGKKLIFIIGTPTHNNIGDLAIAYAQDKFIKSLESNYVLVSVSFEEVMVAKQDILARLIKPGDILIGYGGGNMGDMYLREELCRRKFIQSYPHNKIVIFPQTIYFSDTETGQRELKKTQIIYAAHENLTIIAREQKSYSLMMKKFEAKSVLITPDIVLSLKASNPKQVRNGVLICLRNDIEAAISKKQKTTISKFSEQHFEDIQYTDTISHAPPFNYRNKNRIVEDKLNQFRSAQLVITDRLHGLVFAAITGTPCITLASFNHKVIGTYEWLEHLPYIKFCGNVADLDKVYGELNLESVYDYDPSIYNKYWMSIISTITDVNKQEVQTI